MRAGLPVETSSWAAQTGPAPHSLSRSGASSATSWASACSVSASSSERCEMRRPRRRMTSLTVALPGESRAAAFGESFTGTRFELFA